ILTLYSNFNFELSLFSNFMAYLYVVSGITFYFGSVINPILYNVISNKYRRAFCDLFHCRLTYKRKLNHKTFQINYSTRKHPMAFYIQQQDFKKKRPNRKTSI
ncbi:unnamed protein product, partial [Rotaria sp. Silwood2]